MKFNFSTAKITTLFIIIFMTTSCGNNPLEIDVTDVKINLETQRFEQDLFNHEGDFTAKEIKALNDKYTTFFQDFTQSVINIGTRNNPNFAFKLSDFTIDSYIKEVYGDVNKQYADFTPYEKELEDAFKHYKYYFPKKITPKIITYVSGFNYSIITDDNYLGIGLDMFLGSDYKAYPQLGYPQYKINTMTKDYLVVGAINGWVSTEFELAEVQANLLTEMIHQGKMLYLMDALMPTTANHLKIGYNETQYQWCGNNAKSIWFFFIDNELLYKKETKEIIKYMGEAPFTQGFPEGSPGRVGHYLGWQIVKAYMAKNPTITIEQLMQQTDAQEILNQSKYKP